MKYKAQYTIILSSVLAFIYKISLDEFSWPLDLVEISAELIMFFSCVAVMFYIQQLKAYPGVYWRMLSGSAFYYVYSYMDLLEEFFIQSTVRYSNIDDFIQAIGFILLCVGIHRWLALHRSFIYELKINAETDHLTGLFNRRAFLNRLNNKSKVNKPSKGVFLLIDIDHFKFFNDTYGHASGDAILESIARELSLHIRKSDILSRWGGEEFLLYLDNITEESAFLMAELLRKRIENLYFEFNGEKMHCTISIGCHHLSVEHDIEKSVDCADQALYKAKDLGRNRVVVYNANNLLA